MGYTAHRATIAGGNTPFSKHGMTLYTIQLGLNLVWMPLFFRFKRPVAATVDILALGGTVSYLAYVWGQVDPTCAWLLAPYLGWLSFATYLCVSGHDIHGLKRPNTNVRHRLVPPILMTGISAQCPRRTSRSLADYLSCTLR